MNLSRVTRGSAEDAVLASAVAVSAVGLMVHNFADLPGETVLHPESLYPVLLTTALVAIWFTKFRRAATWALIGWAVLNLVGGGIISVLPLPILPFHRAIDPALPLPPALHPHPDPLLIVAARWLRTTRP